MARVDRLERLVARLRSLAARSLTRRFTRRPARHAPSLCPTTAQASHEPCVIDGFPICLTCHLLSPCYDGEVLRLAQEFPQTSVKRLREMIAPQGLN